MKSLSILLLGFFALTLLYSGAQSLYLITIYPEHLRIGVAVTGVLFFGGLFLMFVDTDGKKYRMDVLRKWYGYRDNSLIRIMIIFLCLIIAVVGFSQIPINGWMRCDNPTLCMLSRSRFGPRYYMAQYFGPLVGFFAVVLSCFLIRARGLKK